MRRNLVCPADVASCTSSLLMLLIYENHTPLNYVIQARGRHNVITFWVSFFLGVAGLYRLLSDSVDMWSAVLCFFFPRFWPSGANHAKTSKNKKQKKQNCRPHWGSCLTLWTCGLQFLFFRGSGHLEQTRQKPRKTKSTKQNCRPHLSDSVDMWSAVFFLYFLLFFRGSGHLEQTMQKPRKNKKTKLQTPLGLLSDSVDMWSAVLFFLVFRGSGHLEQTMQKPRKTKKTKKTKLQTPLGLLFDSVDMWSAVLFFGFSRFWPSGANHAKTSKKQKTADPIGALVLWSAVLVVSCLAFPGSLSMGLIFLYFRWSTKKSKNQKQKDQTHVSCLASLGSSSMSLNLLDLCLLSNLSWVPLHGSDFFFGWSAKKEISIITKA